MELNTRANVPATLDVPFPIEGATSSIKPPNPAARPTITNFVKCFLKINNAKIATQSGIVEFSKPAIPEDKYCSPQARSPCPPRNSVTPRIIADFHCYLLITSLG